MRTILVFVFWVALAACSKHAKEELEIGAVPHDARIARGTLVRSEQDLARMAIRLSAADAPEVYCTGVLIAPRLALSARHCFVNAKLDERGIHLSIAEFPFTRHPEKASLEILRWTAHPSADLALVELSANAPEDYPPIEIRSIGALPRSPLILLGFGRTSALLASDGKLRVGIVHSSSVHFDQAFIETSLEENESSVCPGDSGGPAFVFVDGRYFLVGITAKSDTHCSSYNKFVQPLPFLADFAQQISDRALPGASAAGPDVQNRRLRSLIGWRVEELPAGGQGILVAVVDSGLAAAAAALLKTLVPGYNAISRDSNFADDEGHGTAVAGIIAQLAPGVALLPVKATVDGVGHASDVVDGVVFALRMNSKIINLSIGVDETSLVQIRDAVGSELFEKALLVVAAGNDGHFVERFRENWDNVVIVGATPLDGKPRLTSYSAHGPGVDITAPAGGAGDGITTFDLAMSLRQFNGTSGAAPVVSAVAALVAQKFPQAMGAELKRRLLEGACRIERFQAAIDGNRFLNVPGSLQTRLGCEALN